jgi:hypothetical protein
MPTIKPRITITLEPEAYAVLSQMAKLTKSSMSSILSDLASEAAPVFARVVALVTEAEALKGSVGDRVRQLAQNAEVEMLPIAREAVRTLDTFDAAVRKAIGAAKDAEAAAGSEGAADARSARGGASTRSPRRSGRGAAT